jgi:hypothetical protein
MAKYQRSRRPAFHQSRSGGAVWSEVQTPKDPSASYLEYVGPRRNSQNRLEAR